MYRRNAIVILTAAGLSVVSGPAGATSVSKIGQPHGFKLLHVLVHALHKLLKAEMDFIKSYLGKALMSYGRMALMAAVFAPRVTVGADPHPKLRVEIQQHESKKHLIVKAIVEDNLGHSQEVHTGIAPHATHPDMMRHLDEMARKAHEWLAARNQ